MPGKNALWRDIGWGWGWPAGTECVAAPRPRGHDGGTGFRLCVPHDEEAPEDLERSGDPEVHRTTGQQVGGLRGGGGRVIRAIP